MKKIVIALLTVLLMLSNTQVVFAEDEETVSQEQTLVMEDLDPESLHIAKIGEDPYEEDEPVEMEGYRFDEMVRVSIVLDEPSVVDAGYSVQDYLEDDAAIDNPWYGTAPVRFNTIEYDQQGIYKYKIREKAGNDTSIKYDSHEEDVTVLVTDRGDGRLISQVFYDEDDAHFINEMNGGDLKVTKTLRNATAASSDADFVFVLHLYDSQGNELKESYPVLMPDGSEKTLVSGGSVTIKGDQSFTVKDLPHNSTYKIDETPAEGFEKVSEQNTEGTILAGQTLEATIENAYTVSNTEGGAKIEAKKVFLGGDITEGQFAFRLTNSSGEVLEEVNADVDGKVVFSEIQYGMEDDGGRFMYYIEEIMPENPDPYITYDTHKETVVVNVADTGKGVMLANVEYDKDGAVFTNKTMGLLKITKTLEKKEQVNGRKDPASFIFRVDVTYKGETYLSDVYTMVFDGAESQSIQLDDLPVGATATVTEVYAGGNYQSVGKNTKETTIIRDDLNTEEVELAQIEFTNTHTGSWKGGGSVHNHIVDGKAEASYALESGQ